jgi:hypothetical protein
MPRPVCYVLREGTGDAQGAARRAHRGRRTGGAPPAKVYALEYRRCSCKLRFVSYCGKLVEWIKLSLRLLLPLSLLTGFILFAPQRWLAVFGLVGSADSGGG